MKSIGCDLYTLYFYSVRDTTAVIYHTYPTATNSVQ